MRVGVSSRGNAWVSLGCFGWLFVGPVILAGYVLAGTVMLAWKLCTGLAWLIGRGFDEIQRRRRERLSRRA